MAESPEAVAYELLQRIAYIEKKEIATNQSERSPADRAWLLNTYAECLMAIRAPEQRARRLTVEPRAADASQESTSA